jgi:alkaline phosphatase D
MRAEGTSFTNDKQEGSTMRRLFDHVRPCRISHRGKARRSRIGANKALLLAGAALAAGAARADVAQGPMLQALTADQAGVWVRTSIDQPVRLLVTGPDGVSWFTESQLTSLDDADDTARFLLTGLAADASYTYQVGTTDPDSGIESWTGAYTLHTVGADVAALNIAVLSDFKNGLAPSPALQSAIRTRPDVLAVIGDLDHRDPAAGPGGALLPPADASQVLDQMRRMHRDTRDPANALGAAFYAGIVGTPDTGVAQIPLVYAWDDHDFCSNNSDRTCPFAAQSFQAYGEYYIAAPDNAIARGCDAPYDFQSLRYGALVQLFFLDARSARDEDYPDGDTALLGDCQHAWLVEGLHASTATWKIVLSPVPLNPTVKPWDAWGNFPTERASLLAAIADVPNVLFVSGDLHTGGAIDDGTHSGVPEISTPHAGMPDTWVNTYCRNQNATLISRPGSWTIGGLTEPVLGAQPLACLAKTFPDGYATDALPAPVYPLDGRRNPGYTWINATPTALTVTVRDTKGRVRKGMRADGTSTPMTLVLKPAG